MRHWKGGLLVFLLPSLHLLACLATEVANSVNMGQGWKYIGLADYPVSIVVVGIAWRYHWPPFLLFAVIGTLWWSLLSVAAMFVFDKIRESIKEDS